MGVEVGQIAALALMLVLITSWRRTNSFDKFSFVSNSGLILAGLLLFQMQLHGYQHTVFPDSFGFPKDSHNHVHAEMAEAPVINETNTHESIDLGGL